MWIHIQYVFFLCKSSSLLLDINQTILSIKKQSTKIVNFMTPEAGVLVLRHGHISYKVRIFYFNKQARGYILIYISGRCVKIMHNFDVSINSTLLYEGVIKQLSSVIIPWWVCSSANTMYEPFWQEVRVYADSWPLRTVLLVLQAKCHCMTKSKIQVINKVCI